MAGSSSKQCCSPIGMVCIASILLLIVNPLARAFSVSSRQQRSARGIQVLLHGPTAGARRFGLTLVPRAAQYYDDDEGDYEPRGNYRRGGGGRRDDWRSGRGGAQGGSDEHDYMRSPEDVVSPTDDVAAIDSLLGERLRSKLRRDFDTADSIRYTLEKDYGVTVWDKEKIWTTSAERPGRRGGGQDRPQRMAGEERDFGPTGHDYQQTGGPIDPQHCSLTEDEINALLADRLRAKMSRNFDHADMVKAQLDSAGVSVNDKAPLAAEDQEGEVVDGIGGGAVVVQGARTDLQEKKETLARPGTTTYRLASHLTPHTVL
uniref:Uncharacterized protein n=1 Tax=Heterosigma akashiwo TaxID=2829 RepID=A0A7S4D978_HETAK